LGLLAAVWGALAAGKRDWHEEPPEGEERPIRFESRGAAFSFAMIAQRRELNFAARSRKLQTETLVLEN